MRVWRGKSQAEVAAAIGISERTYRRLEQAQYVNPPLRYLTNAALALRVRLQDLLEPEWLEWWTYDPAAADPPPRSWLPEWPKREPPPFVGPEPAEGSVL